MTQVDEPVGIVVTGLGTCNALGRDVPSFWRRLLAGECGIRRAAGIFGGSSEVLAAHASDPSPLPEGVAGLSRTDRFALAAAAEAVRQAGLPDAAAPVAVAIVVGTTTGGILEAEEGYLRKTRGESVPRSSLLRFEKANTADLLGFRLGLAGPRYTLHSACASSASAIAMGGEIVRHGLADAALAGGSDALARLVVSGFQSLRLVDPAPCRPFDRNRRGLSLGEGAGMLLLEREDSARRRGARPLARLLGAGQSTDAHHLTAPAPEGEGASKAMRSALDQANLPAERVDHVNAHGTGTAANDLAEAIAIRRVLSGGARACTVTAIKGSIGHTLGAAGAIEAIAAIMTIVSGLAPPIVGLADPDPAFGLDFVLGEPRRGHWRTVVSNSFGFGGANTVLCFGEAAS